MALKCQLKQLNVNSPSLILENVLSTINKKINSKFFHEIMLRHQKKKNTKNSVLTNTPKSFCSLGIPVIILNVKRDLQNNYNMIYSSSSIELDKS